MAIRVEVATKEGIEDTRASVQKRKLQHDFPGLKDVKVIDVYTVDSDLTEDQRARVAEMLTHPVFQESRVRESVVVEGDSTEIKIGESFEIGLNYDRAVEIGFLPGVTDNVGNTAREMFESGLGKTLEGQGVYSSRLLFLEGVSNEDANKIGGMLANPVIQRFSTKSSGDFLIDGGMETVVPKVHLTGKRAVDLVDLINAGEVELEDIGRRGIRNADGTFRGPLAMRLSYMKAVKDYFARIGRNPNDIEVETIAQSWSEHCCHTIFADPINEIKEGIFKHFIRAPTEEIRRRKGKDDFCVSIFKDNSGAIIFDERYLITDKVETHNSPSALDPFGGSITGIVGVDRDAMGFGLGAKPFSHRYGFCLASPFGNKIVIPTDRNSDVGVAAKVVEGNLYRDKDKKQKMLSARKIMDGVIDGVNVGGNCSGIPTPLGFVNFDDRYRGKPLVFVGVEGLIPREVNGRKMHEKKALAGDYIVMVGGRVGKDGIHGATFSSESLNTGSPATAVQIGDPITQKKMNDATVKEARDRGLYRSITDNGAGGLSCSVREMGKESGGCEVELEKVPLKYPGIQPWEIWVSESQERMTLAVPPEKRDELLELYKSRGVEATVIGRFTDSGKCVVKDEGKTIVDIDMDFLESGMPQETLKAKLVRRTHEEPEFSDLEDLTDTLHSMLRRNNLASYEFISQQYDHEVQGGSVLKPLQGRGRVNANAVAVRPVLDSKKAVIMSQGINPSYSDIDAYHMAASAIDTAVREAVAAGADLEKIALLDNFCWCSSNDPQRLGELLEAARACKDIVLTYNTPFISGKDSMFNDFKGFDENGNKIELSIPPTLLVSSLSVIENAAKTVSLDAKVAGDLIYVLGETNDELGGSEYFAMRGEEERGRAYVGNGVPKVNAIKNRGLYTALSRAIKEELIASAQSVEKGGLAVALAKTTIGGMLGADIDLSKLPGKSRRGDYRLFSESQGRIVISIPPEYKERFEKIMEGNSFAYIGNVRADNKFVARAGERTVVNTTINEMLDSYKSTFEEF